MANYYPIKCPYCLKSHTNDTVSFRLDDAVEVSRKTIKKSAGDSGADQSGGSGAFYEGGGNWDADTPIEMGDDWDADTTVDIDEDWDTDNAAAQPAYSQGTARPRALPVSGYYTLSELIEVFGAENVRAERKTVLALPALTSAEYNGELLTGATITVTEGDKIIEKTMYTRYCDCDNDRKINANAGSIPSYVILLIGSSDAGKTVYLTSLYHALSEKSRYSFPPTSNPDKAIASLWMSVLSGGIGETDIETMTEELFEDGILPRTTIEMTNEPLALKVTIEFNKTGLVNQALLFIRDMPGEVFTNREKLQELRKITNQFPKFDGFLLTFDPLTFKETVFPSEDSEKARQRRKQVNQLSQVIIENIAPTMANNRINQPAFAIITKGDMFFDRNYTGALKNKGISYAMPLLTVSQKESYDKPYFDEVNSGARMIVEKLSENVANLMRAHFSNVFFSMVSALSRNPIEIYADQDGIRRVRTPNALNPWHVADPMLRLLMKLHIIPPLDETDARPSTGEPADERNARVFRNRSIINEWGAKYCTGGSNINLV